MVRSPGVELLVAVAICATLPSRVVAQGGWSQWDLYLRDGSRIEANPLGAPDDAHLSISVGGFQGTDSTIARSRIALIAAQTTVGPNREPIPGAALPPRPGARVCEDMIVRRDGHQTTGRVTLTKIMYSSGVVTQRGAEIALNEIAYIRFADTTAKACSRKSRGTARPRRVRPA